MTQTLTKKTTILFPPKMYHQLERLANSQGVSVAQLIRQAAIQCYLVPNRKTRMEAVEELSKMSLPVSDWRHMEREIVRGALGQL